MVVKEKFLHKLYRQSIKADFRSNDRIISSAYAGGVSYARPKDYIKSSHLHRRLEITWFSFVFLLFGFVVLAVGLGSTALYDYAVALTVGQALAFVLGSCLLWVYSLYMALVSLGYVRWMWRNVRS